MPQVATVSPDGAAIRARRENRGLTRRQLGNLAGRSESAIRNIENGKQIASVVLISQVARALGVEIAEITRTDDAA